MAEPEQCPYCREQVDSKGKCGCCTKCGKMWYEGHICAEQLVDKSLQAIKAVDEVRQLATVWRNLAHREDTTISYRHAASSLFAIIGERK